MDPGGIAGRLCIQIMEQWKRGFRDQTKSACARGTTPRFAAGIEVKRADGRNQKCAAGEESNRCPASAGPASDASQAKRADGELSCRLCASEFPDCPGGRGQPSDQY